MAKKKTAAAPAPAAVVAAKAAAPAQDDGRIDRTIPGGRYIAEDGKTLINADGKKIGTVKD